MIEKYLTFVNKASGEKQLLETMLKEKENKLRYLVREVIYIEESQIIIQTVAQQTQEKLKIHIEDIVQLALDACFPSEYTFAVQFELKRGKTEARICFLKDGIEINPMDASGGGVVDLTAFALRIASWSLSSTDNIIILDEPVQKISRDLIDKVAKIIKKLSEELNIQFLIVTHIPELSDYADAVFEVTKNNNISKVVKR